MAAQYSRSVLKVAVAQICQNMGWNSIQSSPLELLTDLLERHILQVGKTTHRYSEQFGRTEPNLDDLGLAFRDLGLVLGELEEYVNNVDLPTFSHDIPAFPAPKENRLQFPQSRSQQVQNRDEAITEHLPLMYPDMEEFEESAHTPTRKVPPSGEQNGEVLSPEGSAGSDTLKRMLTSPTSEQPAKKQRLADDVLGSRYEIKNVIMTDQGLISPMRHGKLPDARTPPAPQKQTIKSQPLRKEEKMESTPEKVPTEEVNVEVVSPPTKPESNLLMKPLSSPAPPLAPPAVVPTTKAAPPPAVQTSPVPAMPTPTVPKSPVTPKPSEFVKAMLSSKTAKPPKSPSRSKSPVRAKSPKGEGKTKKNTSSSPGSSAGSKSSHLAKALTEIPKIAPTGSNSPLPPRDDSPEPETLVIDEDVNVAKRARLQNYDDSIDAAIKKSMAEVVKSDSSDPETQQPQVPTWRTSVDDSIDAVIRRANMEHDQEQARKEKEKEKEKAKEKEKEKITKDPYAFEFDDKPAETPKIPTLTITSGEAGTKIKKKKDKSLGSKDKDKNKEKKVKSKDSDIKKKLKKKLKQKSGSTKEEGSSTAAESPLAGQGLGIKLPLKDLISRSPSVNSSMTSSPMRSPSSEPSVVKPLPSQQSGDTSSGGQASSMGFNYPSPTKLTIQRVTGTEDSMLKIKPIKPIKLEGGKIKDKEKSHKKEKKDKKDKDKKKKKKKDKDKDKDRDRGKSEKKEKRKEEKERKKEKERHKDKDKEKKKEEKSREEDHKGKEEPMVPKLKFKLGGSTPSVTSSPNAASQSDSAIDTTKKSASSLRDEILTKLEKPDIPKLVIKPMPPRETPPTLSLPSPPRASSTPKVERTESKIPAIPPLPPPSSSLKSPTKSTKSAPPPPFSPPRVTRARTPPSATSLSPFHFSPESSPSPPPSTPRLPKSSMSPPAVPPMPPTAIKAKGTAQKCVVVTETIGQYQFVDAEGNTIWICPNCKLQDDGSPMIGCDGCDDWYHWVCVGIVNPPSDDEQWFCKKCKERKKKGGKGKRGGGGGGPGRKKKKVS